MMRIRGLALAIALGGALGLGCGGSIGRSNGTGGSSGAGGAGGQGGAGGTGGAPADAGQAIDAADPGSSDGGKANDADPAPAPVPVTCDGIASPQCNDGADNDNDGLRDLADGECVSPCDNDEGSFATGIPGDNMDACKQDCFFDGNSGQGDDGCNWDLRCDPANPGANAGCAYEPGRTCQPQQPDKCVRNCRKLTPNGCDCFGCCAVTYAGGSANVMLMAGCTADQFGNPTVCPRCTPNTACLNTCEPCEVCLGKPAPDPGCAPGGGTDGGSSGSDGGMAPWCPAGVTSCGPTGQVAADGCGVGVYCQTGCCTPYVID